MELMTLYVNFVLGEIKELALLHDLLNLRLAIPDYVEIRRVLVARHSLTIAMHESKGSWEIDHFWDHWCEF